MNEDDNLPALGGGSWRDRGVSLGKGLAGMVPIAGSLLAELIGELLPNQRLNNIEDWLRTLRVRLDELDQADLRAKMEDPERISVFEEGARMASRANSEERRTYIAQLVATGMSGDEKEKIEAKRMLRLLDQIDDDQIVILTAKLSRYMHDESFRALHSEILNPVGTHLGSSRQEFDRDTIYQLARSDLARLGLLRPNISRIKKGDVPEFDEKTGMVKSSGTSLTPLARLLLRHIGLIGPDEM